MCDILKILDERTAAMTIRQCADLLETDETTLYRQSKTGKFPIFTLFGSIRVNPAELASRIRSDSNNPSKSGDQRKDDAG